MQVVQTQEAVQAENRLMLKARNKRSFPNSLGQNSRITPQRPGTGEMSRLMLL